MRKFLPVATVVLSALAFASTALAHDGKRAKAANYGCGSGTLVVNVKYVVQNDLDTTVPIANVTYNWAVDTYARRVLVFQTAANTFCAVTASNGTFTTLAGHSPGGTDTIPAGITGRFAGGYVTNQFHGTLLPVSLSPTTGDLGVKNFACVPSANHDNATKSCPGTFDWFSQYFTPTSGADWALVKYAFVYKAEGHGVWSDTLSNGVITTRGDIVATAKAWKKAKDHSEHHHDNGHNQNHDEHGD
jgi:hypothetical protein